MTRSRLRRLVALALLLALLAAAAAAWRARRELAERWLLAALRERGATPAALRVVEVGPDGLALEGLVVGEPTALRIDRLEVGLTLASLLSGRLARAEARGVRLTGRLGPEGLELGAAHGLLLGADPGEAGPGAIALPAQRVALREARAELATPWGPLILDGGLEGGEGPQGELAVAGAVTARHALGRAEARAEAQGPPEALEGRLALHATPSADAPVALEAPFAMEGTAARTGEAVRLALRSQATGFTAALAGRRLEGRLPALAIRAEASPGAPAHLDLALEGGPGRLRDPAAEVEAALSALALTLRSDALEGGFALAVRDLHAPARMAPLRVEGALGGSPAAPEARVRLLGPGDAALAVIRMDAGEAEAGWTMRGRLEPIDLAALDLPRLAPAAAERLGRELAASGTVEGRLRAGPTDGGLEVRAELALREVDLRTELATIHGLTGALRLVGPPWRTPERELLAMARLDVGLPLDEGTLVVALRPGGRLELLEGTWRFAGGRIRAGAELDLHAARQSGVLVAEGLDVAALVALLDVEGLEGTGTLAGALPVHLEAGRLEVRGGVLRSVGGGRLRWRPPGRAGLAARPGLDVLLAALDDFRYERIELGLEGDLRGALDVSLDLRGHNPNLQEGRPVELHVQVDARLADLVRAGRASYRVPEIIEERLRDFSTGRDR